MEFRVLGPVEVVDSGSSLPLGGTKQRTLLAVLLLQAGHVVPTGDLIEEIWPGEQPATARHALHVHASQLRKALRSGRPDCNVLFTSPAGYAVRLEQDELDLECAEGLMHEGSRALSTGDAATAATSLRAALALWTGEPLSDLVGGPMIASATAHLTELRLCVLEDRIAADLALGRHTELVGELTELVSLNPLRERLRGQLILALYRSGRQAEALLAYRETRRLLVESYGLEPSPPLQRLERLILAQDAALELPHSAVDSGLLLAI
jgi:DNA-binding SARP family transcriptional activator